MENVPAPLDGVTQSKAPKPPKPESKAQVGTSAEKKLSGAELKKLKQAEKAAKRAAAKSQGGPSDQGASAAQGKKEKQPQQQKGQKQSQAPSKGQSGPQTPVTPGQTRDIPLRRRPSTSAPAVQPVVPDKKVGLFGHLYGQQRRHGIAGASKDVHPAILALGLQMSSYEICGSTARCVAMLLAFKSVHNPSVHSSPCQC
jgi:translation initiation factor eIF-2B subunit delta